ncbi:MAG: 2-oxoglutarate dehydrogenase complex dihydrolipoyllysine-residue succinyltransferase, partial [Spirochaetaceae bacterium]
MKSEVKVPEVGESVTSGILAGWLKEDGETVSEGEELFELETDKATLAVPAPADGVLSIQVSEGTEVEVGRTVAVVDTEAAAGPGDRPAEGGATDHDAVHHGTPAHAPDHDAAEEGTAEESSAEEGPSPRLSPAVRRVVAEYGLDPSEITPTGKSGRILKKDALRAAEARSDEKAGTAEPQARSTEESPTGSRAESRTGSAAAPQPAAAKSAPSQPSPPAEERRRRVKMSTLRRRIAENMVASKQSAAHLTTFNEVDMSAIMELRSAYRDTFLEKHEVKLGFMSFFVKAACAALAAYPEVNAFIDGEEIVYNDFYNIGVAVSTERGLIVPVLRDADTKSFAQIEREILDYTKRAGDRRIMPDELTGGTFTISNGGVFGSMLSTPIPNPPQTAVLGMHAIQKRPVAVNEEVVIRPMMYLALTYDHRLIDGREAVR